MYKTLYIICLLCLFPFHYGMAQNENKSDSIAYANEISNYEKTVDGFLIDSKLTIIAPPPLLPSLFSPNYAYSLSRPINLNEKFHLKSNLIYSGANTFNDSYLYRSPLYMGGSNVSLQSITYKLKNGLRVSTYGEYDADGYKRYNPSALPWEKNDFHGAFEIKSENGNFGIRVGVQKY